MGPKTRSQASKVAGPSVNQVDGEVPADEIGDQRPDERDTISVVEGHLTGLTRAFKSLEREVEELRRKNEALSEDLANAREEAENASQPKRGDKAGVTAKTLQKQVANLTAKIRDLDKTHQRDKRKIAKLLAKEVKRDADDLADQEYLEAGDTPYKMRKLLRKFNDLMLAATLEADEECAICMDTMEIGKATSFPCEHTFCENCVRQHAAARGLEDGRVQCPACRREADSDELEIVQYTATTQWDALLAVAASWAKIDHRREQDTSEEEAEEAFLNDGGDATDGSVVPEPETGNSVESSPEPEVPAKPEVDTAEPLSQSSRIRRIQSPPLERPPSPPAEPDENGDGRTSRHTTPEVEAASGYSQSPRSEKRRRMEELAMQREQKRARRF